MSVARDQTHRARELEAEGVCRCTHRIGWAPVLALESEVAQSIAQKVEVTVTGQEQQRLIAASSVAPEVYESYLKGRYAASKATDRAGYEQSVGYFEDAIRRDPAFAPAYLGLAEAYS